MKTHGPRPRPWGRQYCVSFPLWETLRHFYTLSHRLSHTHFLSLSLSLQLPLTFCICSFLFFFFFVFSFMLRCSSCCFIRARSRFICYPELNCSMSHRSNVTDPVKRAFFVWKLCLCVFNLTLLRIMCILLYYWN